MSVLYDLYKLQPQLQQRYGIFIFTSKFSNIKQTFKIYRENKDENKIIILGCFGDEQAGHHYDKYSCLLESGDPLTAFLKLSSL